MKGDADFERYILDLTRYQTAGKAVRFDLRGRAGTAKGKLPQQYLYDLGGFSTLRGYRFKEFTGDRMLLLNAECWVDVNRFWDNYWFLDGVNLGGFVDIGSAWFSGDPPEEGDMMGYLYKRDIKTSAGWGLDFEDFRLYFAKPTGSDGDKWDVSFRISRSF